MNGEKNELLNFLNRWLKTSSFAFRKRSSYIQIRKFKLRRYPLAKMTCEEYIKAVNILNSLQPSSKMAVGSSVAQKRMDTFALHLDRLGITQDDLSKLNVIHVSGTKGKGSVCAFTESVLRNSGFKTGFLSSPHLIDIVERVRINGTPISQKQFAECLHEIYNKLWPMRSDEFDMPPYVFLLNIVAFKVFIDEKVDVAVLEVGLGGTFDSTNIVRNPVVCGVTTLDFDHQRILGYSIEEIAWNKAGIFKPGVPALTLEQAIPGALSKLKECAEEKGVRLQTVEMNIKLESVELGLDGFHQKTNASLAVELSNVWAEQMGFEKLNPVKVTQGLKNVRWPGRCETVKIDDNLTFYLDGAHTAESLKLCLNWFRTKFEIEHQQSAKKVLVCTFTSDRNDENFLRIISNEVSFDYVVFTPPRLRLGLDFDNSATYNARSVVSMETYRCRRNMAIWKETNNTSEVSVHENIDDAFNLLRIISTDTEICVLVTGSLYLVGGVLKLLKDITDSIQQ